MGAVALVGAWYVNLQSQLRPVKPGGQIYIRFEEPVRLEAALKRLEEKGIIRSASAMGWQAKVSRQLPTVNDGTYALKPGMSKEQIFAALRKPVAQMVRLPEGFWIARTAQRLEEKGVCTAAEYIALASNGSAFADAVSFPVPAGSLEGYLYPDTYDLPPMLGAHGVIVRQLKAFESKAWPLLKNKPNLIPVLTKASMVQAEVAKDEERARVAGVINNRLAKPMRLEIDATVLYGIQTWRVLKPGEVRKLTSPYNTYLNNGLPPGPINSPTIASIKGVLSPEKHGYFYYVARPTKTHYFAATYDEHIANIKKARGEFRAVQGTPQ